MSRCDLHIHSRYSARSEEWLFRRFDFPDSYSDPGQLYEQLLTHGMDYVTITDHDTIEGCLQIAHLPRTFISEQVTTYFPQDPCKLHILVWGISERQHREIQRVRDNVFDLQPYLQAAQIAHAVAHPLYSVNGRLEARHLEQLMLLFKHFEGINGLRDALLSDLTQTLLKQQTPEKIDALAHRGQVVAVADEARRDVVDLEAARDRGPAHAEDQHADRVVERGRHRAAVGEARRALVRRRERDLPDDALAVLVGPHPDAEATVGLLRDRESVVVLASMTKLVVRAYATPRDAPMAPRGTS